jgi:hypothetical protein
LLFIIDFKLFETINVKEFPKMMIFCLVMVLKVPLEKLFLLEKEFGLTLKTQ